MPNPPDPLLAPLVIDLPPVERAARMPGGFAAVGTTAGIKASGRQDFALVVADGGPVPAAAVFTPNRFAAAPVQLSRANLRATGGSELMAGYARAVIATSGSANAATGPAGDADQAAIGEAVATALGADPTQVLHLSTGIIGTRLPVDKVTATVARVAAGRARGDGRCPRVRGALAPDHRLHDEDGLRPGRPPRGRRRRSRDGHRLAASARASG